VRPAITSRPNVLRLLLSSPQQQRAESGGSPVQISNGELLTRTAGPSPSSVVGLDGAKWDRFRTRYAVSVQRTTQHVGCDKTTDRTERGCVRRSTKATGPV
jgi:hypothetical protein